MQLFPFFQDITDKKFVVIGSGRVASEKIERLKMFTDNIEIVSSVSAKPQPDSPNPDHYQTQESGQGFRQKSAVEALSGADYCICATDDRDLNRCIAEECSKRGIFVNVVDDPELCTFVFPALVKKGDLVIGISTQGTSPAYAGDLRRQIEADLPDNIEEILDRMGNIRKWLPDNVPNQKDRKQVYRVVLAALLESDGEITDSEIDNIVKQCISANT